ncbi:hypothetical protein [Kribbella sp. DT2]|uniref:hypothetical protein n=1 Tax=Kribbella sp. DT2 TaxID=3393427 RepID=UPI003CF415F5
MDAADKLGSALSLVVALAALLASTFSRSNQPAVTQSADPPPIAASPESPFRSAYLEYVKQIAPVELLDREPELAAMAAFCADDDSFYWRWVADAWSGKSALMAWFVLHPPMDVDVVAFFVNSRVNPHYNRDAFIDCVLEQFAGLVGEVPASPMITAVTRAAQLRRMLADAAESAAARGRHLVLVVDGLDEDRVVTPTQELYSIAAMLPDRPLRGLKVIAAGRPNPPLPVDVPADHPLRDPQVQRTLGPSAHAKASQQAATLELRSLLQQDFPRELLLLVTAAGGGLTAQDLAALTARHLYEVEEVLSVSTGRTFLSFPPVWGRAGPHSYGLAHEELRVATLRSLGSAVGESCARLSAWADTYQSRGWPGDTPEYLLRGYLGMLLDAGDVARALPLAVDKARHDRMLNITGADDAAFLETAAVRAVVVAEPEPDLAVLALLAFHCDELQQHAALVPVDLPAALALLGDLDRAFMLARSMEPLSRGLAMPILFELAAERGEIDRLEAAALEASSLDERACALAALLTAAEAEGRQLMIDDQIEMVLTARESAVTQSSLSVLAMALARTGREAGADRAVRRLPADSARRVRALTQLLVLAVQQQRPQRIVELETEVLAGISCPPSESVAGRVRVLRPFSSGSHRRPHRLDPRSSGARDRGTARTVRQGASGRLCRAAEFQAEGSRADRQACRTRRAVRRDPVGSCRATIRCRGRRCGAGLPGAGGPSPCLARPPPSPVRGGSERNSGRRHGEGCARPGRRGTRGSRRGGDSRNPGLQPS